MTRCHSEEGVAGVIIHESRFTYESYGLSCLINLGQKWEQDTKIPLPLGGVAIHRRVPDSMASCVVSALGYALDAAREDHQSILPLMQNLAQEMSEEVMMQHVELYVNEHSRHLGEVACRAIETLSGVPVEVVKA
jgi:1,4-dihydroxy-6-naphthoate synthase